MFTVVIGYLWNYQLRIIKRIRESKILKLNTLMKKEMVRNNPYCKQASMYVYKINGVSNHVISHFSEAVLISFGRWVMRLWKLMTQLACIGFIYRFLCLFGVFVPHENFSLISSRHHWRWRAANVGLYLTHMAIDQWKFFSVPRLLWHRTWLYIGHLRGPVTLTPYAVRLAEGLSLPVLTT